jgi:hypothetical protein
MMWLLSLYPVQHPGIRRNRALDPDRRNLFESGLPRSAFFLKTSMVCIAGK